MTPHRGSRMSSQLVAMALRLVTPSSGAATAYLYDASGQRFAAISGSSATVYVGAWEAADPNTGDGSNADVTLTRYYSAGGVQLASKSTGGSTLITLGDVQGSAQVTVDATGAVTRNAYTPYGTKRAGSNVALAHGWLNQIADADTGLTYLNARYYDPELGRFLSPDPLMNPGDPRTLDPYRYADNNPVVYMDASGLNPSCGTYSAATQVCWSSYASVNATDPATKAAHKTVVLNSKGRIPKPSASECLGMLGGCRAIDAWNSTMPFTPITLKQADAYNLLVKAKAAPDIHVPGTVEILGETASLTAYEFFLGDAERCAGGSASGCGFAVLGILPLIGKVGGRLANLGRVPERSADVLPTPTVASPKLQNIVDDLYKGTDSPFRTGNGTTMDAITFERVTGKQVGQKFHLQKGQDSLRGLDNWLRRNPDGVYHDRLVAQSLANELREVLGGAG